MNCNRRTLLKTAATLIVLPAAGAAKAVSVCPATDITIPPEKDLISSFGWVTDVHCSVQPVRRIDNEDSTRVYAHSLAKLRQATDLFNTRKLDFVIELGDFKDCKDDGDREGTLEFLRTVEREFSRYNGPRYHVAGNHDFDKITYEDFVTNVTNPGDANGKSYYSFVRGGVKYIVLDACYKDTKGSHYSEGNFNWVQTYVPDEELAWFKKELATGSEPIIVFTHQNLNYWDKGPMNNWFIKNAADVVSAMEQSGRVLAALSGHYHRGLYSVRNGIHYVVNQGLVERALPRNVFGIVHVGRDHTVYVEGFYNERSHVCKPAKA